MDNVTRDELEGAEFHNTYTDALAQIIEAKREDKPLPEAPEPEQAGGKVFDLMAALNESMARAKASRGEGPAEMHELPKTTAKKPAKTTATERPRRRPRRRRHLPEQSIAVRDSLRGVASFGPLFGPLGGWLNQSGDGLRTRDSVHESVAPCRTRDSSSRLPSA